MSEQLYFAVNDVEQETIEAMQKIAYMGYHRLQLIKTARSNEWGTLHKSKKERLWDLSRGTLFSWRQAKLEAIDTAERFLELYGGSAKRKKRGLEELAEKRENIENEKR